MRTVTRIIRVITPFDPITDEADADEPRSQLTGHHMIHRAYTDISEKLTFYMWHNLENNHLFDFGFSCQRQIAPRLVILELKQRV